MMTPERSVSRPSSGRFRWSLRLLGLLILALLLRQLDLAQLVAMIHSLRPGLLLAAIALTAPFFAVKSWRWRVILRSLGIEISRSLALQLYGAGLFAGQLTPGQLGEVVRAYFLWRRGHDALLATSSVVLDRVLDLVVLVVVAVPGLGLVLGWGQELALLTVVVGVVGILLLLRPQRLWRVLATRLQRWPRLAPMVARVDELLTTLVLAMRAPGAAGIIGLTTVLALALNFVRFYLLLLALGLSLPAGRFVFGVALANLAGLLPITVAGVGVRDAVLVLIFQQAGQPAEGAVAFSLLILLVAYGLNVVWGFPAWLLEAK